MRGKTKMKTEHCIDLVNVLREFSREYLLQELRSESPELNRLLLEEEEHDRIMSKCLKNEKFLEAKSQREYCIFHKREDMPKWEKIMEEEYENENKSS